MDLTFNKDGGSFVAEFVATADFNLHIEKSGGDIRIMQKTTENGKYDSIDGLYIPAGNPVIDYDFVASIYPKYIKIVSEVEPTLAVVTSAGEVTEIGAKNTFSIKKHVVVDDTPQPTDEPAMVFEFPREGMTWREYCAENSDFVLGADGEYSMVGYKGTHVLSTTTDFSSVVLGDDSIISGYEYLATYWQL